MAFRCPGQDRRFWKPSDIYDHPCPHCGEEMEFFRDDISLRCANCRRKIANPKLDLGCAAWCSYAEQCLGQVAKTYQQRPEALRHRLEVEVRRQLLADGETLTGLSRALRRLEKKLPESEEDTLYLVAACLLYPIAEQAEAIMDKVEMVGEARGRIMELLDELQGDKPSSPAAQLIASAYLEAAEQQLPDE